MMLVDEVPEPSRRLFERDRQDLDDQPFVACPALLDHPDGITGRVAGVACERLESGEEDGGHRSRLRRAADPGSSDGACARALGVSRG
ncbi:hypothetical protein QE388_000030 [Microbacterium sp. SORGH_AS 969]|nr:hypothetical protein [Microbacterium sp. SORGH_AS_0969]